MSEKIPRYRAYTIDGQLCRDCDSNTLKELNKKKKKKKCQSKPRGILCAGQRKREMAMSELKEYLCIDAKEIEYTNRACYRFTSATKAAPEACMESVYLKPEVDAYIAGLENQHLQNLQALEKYWIANCKRHERNAILDTANYYKSTINHHKYKRCLAMMKWCASKVTVWTVDGNEKKADWCWKWLQHWLELAEKFKEEKNRCHG